MVQVRKLSRPVNAAAAAKELAGSLDAGLFKALGDPTRLRLLSCLARCCRPCSVKEAAVCCDVDYSVVSRHLSQLAEAGVLTSERDGQSTRYTVAFGPLSEALRRLSDAIAASDPAHRNTSRCSCLCCCSSESRDTKGCR